MHIDVSGHHLAITDSIRQAAHQKIEKVHAHFPAAGPYKAILTVEPNTQIAEISTQFLGNAITVEARNNDLYCAITAAAKKLEAKLRHKKGICTANRNQKFAMNEEASLPAE